MTGSRLILFVLVLGGGCLVPWLSGPYYTHLAIMTLMAAALALSWDVLARTGQLSLAHSGFYGLGAYVTAILITRLSVHPLMALVGAAVVAAAVASLLGLATLRIHGIYFAIATFSFSEVLRVLALQLSGVTGGAVGVTVPSFFSRDRVDAYFAILAVVLLALGLSYYVNRSPLRFSFAAIRSKPEVASALGVDVTRTKVLAFAVTAIFPALVGGFYLLYVTYIIPYEAFSLNISVAALVMPVFGGLYTSLGPLIGAVALKIVEEYLRVTIVYGYTIIYGIILALVILLFPSGLVGLVRGLERRFSERRGAGASRSQRTL